MRSGVFRYEHLYDCVYKDICSVCGQHFEICLYNDHIIIQWPQQKSVLWFWTWALNVFKEQCVYCEDNPSCTNNMREPHFWRGENLFCVYISCSAHSVPFRIIGTFPKNNEILFFFLIFGLTKDHAH